MCLKTTAFSLPLRWPLPGCACCSGRRLAFRAMAVEGAERFDEGFLCQVFRQLPLAHHPIDEVEHGRAVAAHHFVIGVFITLARPRHDVVVGCLGGLESLVIIVTTVRLAAWVSATSPSLPTDDCLNVVAATRLRLVAYRSNTTVPTR